MDNDNFTSVLEKDIKRNTSNETHRILNGLFWSFSGSGLQTILQTLVLIVLSRLLTPADFGLVNAASLLIGFSAIFSTLGVGPAIVQRKTLELAHLRTGFTISILFGFLITGLFWIMAPIISIFFRMNGLTQVLRVTSFIFIFQSSYIIAQSLLQRTLQFRILVGIEVVSYFIGFGVVGVSLALMDFGVWALVTAQLVQSVVNCLLLLIVQPHPKMPKIDRQALKELMDFGAGFTIANISNYWARNGDYLVVGRFLGAEALGLYKNAYKLATLPANVFGAVLDRVLFPAMSKEQDASDRLATTYRRAIMMIALLTLPMSATMFGLAPELIHKLLGIQWEGAIIPFQILCIGALFRTSYKISDSIIRAKGAVKHLAWLHSIYTILIVGGALLGQYWGISGVAIAVLIALTMFFTLMAKIALDITSMSWNVFLLSHIPGLSLSFIIFLEVFTIKVAMKLIVGDDLAIIFTSIFSIFLTILILGLLRPTFLLSKDDLHVLDNINIYIVRQFKLHIFKK
ncbi:MAG TPA: lipopolysaccharide biosynthesis protein [Candidatus Brocadiaceae bacterium]